MTCSPRGLRIGDKLKIEVGLMNESDDEVGALVDLRVHFVKANGSTSAKVFKGSEVEVAAGGRVVVKKTISLAQHSTRRHYPGEHRVEVVVNGAVCAAATFHLAAE